MLYCQSLHLLAPSDYNISSNTIEIDLSIGEQTLCIEVNPLADGIMEGAEEFTLSLTNPGASLIIVEDGSVATVTIIDRDGKCTAHPILQGGITAKGKVVARQVGYGVTNYFVTVTF